MARTKRDQNRKRVLLRLDMSELADLLHLPEDLEPLSMRVDPHTDCLEIVFTSPECVREVGPGMQPMLYRWYDLVAGRHGVVEPRIGDHSR